jgi:hypothetical protein
MGLLEMLEAPMPRAELSRGRHDRSGCQCWDCYSELSRAWLEEQNIPTGGALFECPSCDALLRVYRERGKDGPYHYAEEA